MQLYRALRLSLFCAVLSAPSIVWSDEVQQMQEQISELKEELLILQDQLEETNSANANEMKISGYADIEYHDSSEPGTNPGFRLHHMSIFFEKHVNSEWKFFSEIEYEDAPFLEYQYTDSEVNSNCKGCYGKIFLESANFTYTSSPQLNIRGGRFFTPAGIWSVDHYPSFTPSQLRPGHIRRIFPQVIDGISIFGTQKIGSIFSNYTLYVGNGEGNSGKQDNNMEKATGAKISFLFPQIKYLEIGASSYQDTVQQAGIAVEKSAIGAHLKMKLGGLTLQSEYANGIYTPAAGGEYERVGYYLQALYDFSKWTVGFRHDFYDEDTTAEKDVVFKSILLNYQFDPSIVFKLEHHSVEDEDVAESDYEHTIASVVLYLGN